MVELTDGPKGFLALLAVAMATGQPPGLYGSRRIAPQRWRVTPLAEEQHVDEQVVTDDAVVNVEPEDIDEGDLAELGVDDDLLAEDEVPDDEPAVDLVDDVDEVDDGDGDGGGGETEADEEAAASPAPAPAEEEDEEEDEDEEDDVEASLDVILKEKLVVAEEEADEEAPDQEERVESSVNRVLPKQPDEFVCTSCFLVKHPSQLADGERMRCRDCV